MTDRARIHSTVLLAVIVVLSGCSRDDAAATKVQAVPGISSASLGLASQPCMIVLAPDPNGDANDRLSRADEAIFRFREAATRYAEPAGHLERLGWAYVGKARESFDSGYFTLAEQTAMCIESVDPANKGALLLRGHVLHALHQFRQAETLARKLVAQRGLWFDYGLLGDVLMEQGKLDPAIEAYQEMMDQRPGPQAYSRAAHMRWLKGDLRGAIELMQMTVKASGARDAEAAAWSEVRLALYVLQAGWIDAAKARVAAALALHADYAPAHFVRGRILLAQERPAEAVQSLTRAVQIHPLPEYQWTLVDALRVVGRFAEAGAVEEQLLQTGATEDRRTYALYLATTQKDVATSLQLAKRELGERADVFTLDAMAWALNAAGRVQEARELSERALAEGTQDARLLYHAGIIAGKAGELEKSKRWLDAATAIKQMLLPSERGQLAKEFAALARISHHPSTAEPPDRASTALRLARVLNVVSATPPRSDRRAPCIRALWRPLATMRGEKCGLEPQVTTLVSNQYQD